MANVYSDVLGTRKKARELKSNTPQTQVIPGREKEMTRNNAGGVSFKLDEWGYATRFLILGSTSPTYYASAKKLTTDNATAIVKCVKEDGIRLVDLIVEISEKGRAPKNDPALLALAIAMTHGDKQTQSYAADALPKVARIGTHVLHFADYINGMRSWGRPVRRAFSNVYNGWNSYGLALNLAKYANRDGWTHKDVLRLAHVRPSTPDHDALFGRALEKGEKVIDDRKVADFLSAIERVKTANDAKVVAKLVEEFRLPREVIPTQFLNDKNVWAALLPHMGMTALVRNLATLTRVGNIAPLSNGTKLVLDKLGNDEEIKKSRIHPIQLLSAYLTYKAGQGVRGGNTWTPNQTIVAALDEAFYMAFQNIIPAGARVLFAMDVSGSMEAGIVGDVRGLTPRLASAALVAMLMRTEKQYEVIGFTSGGGYWGASRKNSYDDVSGVSKLRINHKMSLDEIIRAVRDLPFGGTDCALPYEYARVNKIPVDLFVTTTDSETWAGNRQPSQALKAYRDATGIAARGAVFGMVANGFTIADPNDSGMMDFVGFDSAAPALLNDFARGDL